MDDKRLEYFIARTDENLDKIWNEIAKLREDLVARKFFEYKLIGISIGCSGVVGVIVAFATAYISRG